MPPCWVSSFPDGGVASEQVGAWFATPMPTRAGTESSVPSFAMTVNVSLPVVLGLGV